MMVTTTPESMSAAIPPEIAVSLRPPEQRARILGTGIEVWQVVRTYYEVNEDWKRLRACYDWLTEKQLRAAMAYGHAHWEPIAARIAEEYARLPDDLRDGIPAHWR